MSESAKPAALPKVRIATTSLAGCFGCHTSLLDIASAYSNYVDEASPGRDIGEIRDPQRVRPGAGTGG